MRSFSVNVETFLLAAWMSSQQSQREKVIRLRKENGLQADERYIRDLLAEQMHVLAVRTCYARLLECRIALLDLSLATWAIRSEYGIHPKAIADDEPERVHGYASQETWVVIDSIAGDALLRESFRSMSQEWGRNVVTGAGVLQKHFERHNPFFHIQTEMSFLFGEFIQLSLRQVTWEEVAAHLLGIPFSHARDA